MYQSLSGLPKDVLLDANVLLNACFVNDSSARAAVSELLQLGFLPFIASSVKAEAERIVVELTSKNNLQYEPLPLLEKFLRDKRIPVTHTAIAFSPEAINRSDQHVYSAAKVADAWILTADVNFMAECHRENFPCRLPWDVLWQSALHKKEGKPPLDYLLRFAGISRDHGSVFARVFPGEWAGRTNVGKFTVCDIENVMTIAYDTSISAWTLSIPGEEQETLPLSISHRGQWTLCADYRYSAKTAKHTASLKAYFSEECQGAKSFEMKSGLGGQRPGQISYGHTLNRTNYWNGTLSSVVVGPRPIGKNSWKALRANPNSTPDPGSADIVEAALKSVGFVQGNPTMPSERELRESWI